jgi:hypothetical protein
MNDFAASDGLSLDDLKWCLAQVARPFEPRMRSMQQLMLWVAERPPRLINPCAGRAYSAARLLPRLSPMSPGSFPVPVERIHVLSLAAFVPTSVRTDLVLGPVLFLAGNGLLMVVNGARFALLGLRVIHSEERVVPMQREVPSDQGNGKRSRRTGKAKQT